jgi:hypothetical protein
VQEKVVIDEDKETLGSSYGKLHDAIQALFKRHWDRIRTVVKAKPHLPKALFSS